MLRAVNRHIFSINQVFLRRKLSVYKYLELSDPFALDAARKQNSRHLKAHINIVVLMREKQDIVFGNCGGFILGSRRYRQVELVIILIAAR